MGIVEIFKYIYIYISLPFFYSFIQNNRKKKEKHVNVKPTHKIPIFFKWRCRYSRPWIWKFTPFLTLSFLTNQTEYKLPKRRNQSHETSSRSKAPPYRDLQCFVGFQPLQMKQNINPYLESIPHNLKDFPN